MKKLHSLIFLSSLFLLLASCESEIEIDYRSIDKIPVIEGHLTNEATRVLITETRNMEDSTKGRGISGATVTLTANNGTYETLEYRSDGYYHSPSNLIGTPGITYTLSVLLNGQEYTSYSTMQQQAAIISATFNWERIMNTRILFYSVEIQDIAGEENYYCYHMYRNGELYSWDVFSDKGHEDGIIAGDIFCMDETTAEENKPEDRKEILYDGDLITLEIKAIDRRTYDYLYSLGLGERAAANSIPNFTGNSLGYFSAHSIVRHQETFHYE